MTNEEKRIKIAEACGWTATVDEDQFWRATRADGSYTSELWCSQDNVWSVGIPNYFSDLNACHEMENALGDDKIKWKKYSDYLTNMTQDSRPDLFYTDKVAARYKASGATASQRAEAFGKTLNLW